MVLSLLILVGATVILHVLVHYFLYDLISAPFNITYYLVTYGSITSNVQKRTWLFYFMGLLMVIVFSYLFLGIVTAYLSWVTIRHPDNFFMKIFAVVLATGIVSRFKEKRRQMLLQDISYNYIPSVFIAPYIYAVTFVISVILLVFPHLLNKYWSWAVFGQTL